MALLAASTELEKVILSKPVQTYIPFDDSVLKELAAGPRADLRAIAERLRRRVDVVVSDMAPNLSGIPASDAARMAHLVELAVAFAQTHLQAEGALVCKAFHGSGYSQMVRLFKELSDKTVLWETFPRIAYLDALDVPHDGRDLGVVAETEELGHERDAGPGGGRHGFHPRQRSADHRAQAAVDRDPGLELGDRHLELGHRLAPFLVRMRLAFA